MVSEGNEGNEEGNVPIVAQAPERGYKGEGESVAKNTGCAKSVLM